MRRIIGLAVVLGALGWGQVAQATPFSITYTMTVALTSGTDILGLDGATLELIGFFDTTDVYANFSGLPKINSTSDSLTISGASVVGTNGVYSESSGGLGFFPTFDGQMRRPGGGIARYLVGGEDLFLNTLVDPVAGISIGDPISVSDFGTTIFNATNFSTDLGASYTITSLQFSSSSVSVPEPSTLLLLGTGLAAVALRRRRQP